MRVASSSNPHFNAYLTNLGHLRKANLFSSMKGQQQIIDKNYRMIEPVISSVKKEEIRLAIRNKYSADRLRIRIIFMTILVVVCSLLYILLTSDYPNFWYYTSKMGGF